MIDIKPPLEAILILKLIKIVEFKLIKAILVDNSELDWSFLNIFDFELPFIQSKGLTKSIIQYIFAVN